MVDRPPSLAARAAALFASSLVVSGTSLLGGCLSRPIEPQDTRTTNTIVERLPQRVDKIDLLLTIDNSTSMKDKQDILQDAVPDLVGRLVNPRCVDPLDPKRSSAPKLPSDPCPSGMEREFLPITDIHIGIISTSIGDHGAGSCPVEGSSETAHFSKNDKGHLVARSDVDDASSNDNDPPTYQGLGFLAWDPEQKLSPAGEAVFDDLAGGGLVPTLKNMVRGVGDRGCGYESQLESWYRFLVDPSPYASIAMEGRTAVLKDVDEDLLAQRRAFLRPDSLLAIIMLSDENDCSIREGGQSYVAAYTRNNWRMFRPRSECAEKGPADACCKSCWEPRGDCPVDPTCGPEGEPARLTEEGEDPYNLRCFDQKRRFGMDLLYTIDRYTKALTEPTVADRDGEIVPNPLFSDLDPTDANNTVRSPDLVFFAGIVGVPWQDIARVNEAGKPDLIAGKDGDGNDVGGFKSASELARPNAGASSTWEIILGDPAKYAPPLDPHMIESPKPRSGENPITGTAIAGPDSPDNANDINGHEWFPDEGFGDLQYACVFPLKTPMEQGDDCNDVVDRKNPLCENRADGTDSPRQVKAKAYPGLRQLQLIRDLGDQGIVGSVCPKQLEDNQKADYGYRPAVGAIIDRLKTKLGGQCLARALTPDENGQVSCLVLEARTVPDGQCRCDEHPARRKVPDQHAVAEREVLQDPISKASGKNCVCEVEQLIDPAELKACQDTAPPAPVEVGGERVNGWCYVDPGIGVGEPEVVAKCPSTERRQVRFTGEGEALPGATQFVICSGDSR
ncbi:hypothetical protein [Sorangium sp. So ce131]|uniref:hypothetical protein n=1 Tax=Sorangium sp. So ce131 TaxID=3133282 RepID=UPI003F5F1823